MQDKAQELFGKFNFDYAEFRRESVFSTSISLRDNERSVSSGRAQGISVRMLVSGSWGFASTDDLSRIGEIFERAFRMARVSKGKSRIEIKPVYSGKGRTKTKVSLEGVCMEKKMQDMQEIQKNLAGKSISSRSVRYSDSSSKEEFINSEGAETEQEISRVYLAFTSVAKSGGLMERASERIGLTVGYEAVDECFKLSQECPKRARALLSAHPAPPGKCTTVVDGRMAGLLCHEALGHACEADSILSNSSILKGRMGRPIGSPLVTIYDNSKLPGAFGSYFFDDEGVRAQKTVLVSNGKLTSLLQSLETAAKLGAKPTGNARAQSYSFTPIVRMSNTCMEKGESEVDELFEGIKHGVYARGMNGGCVDTTTGYFVFGAEDGFLIENGKKTRFLRDVLLSGNILESLKNIDMIANDFSGSPGFCGKMGQAIPVSDGGPHVRIKSLMVGGNPKVQGE